jgi:hypothetical protein
LTLELVEESILSDVARTHSRRTLADGTELDLTAYGEFGVLVTFHLLPDGRIEFIDILFFDD